MTFALSLRRLLRRSRAAQSEQQNGRFRRTPRWALSSRSRLSGSSKTSGRAKGLLISPRSVKPASSSAFRRTAAFWSPRRENLQLGWPGCLQRWPDRQRRLPGRHRGIEAVNHGDDDKAELAPATSSSSAANQRRGGPVGAGAKSDCRRSHLVQTAPRVSIGVSTATVTVVKAVRDWNEAYCKKVLAPAYLSHDGPNKGRAPPTSPPHEGEGRQYPSTPLARPRGA